MKKIIMFSFIPFLIGILLIHQFVSQREPREVVAMTMQAMTLGERATLESYLGTAIDFEEFMLFDEMLALKDIEVSEEQKIQYFLAVQEALTQVSYSQGVAFVTPNTAIVQVQVSILNGIEVLKEFEQETADMVNKLLKEDEQISVDEISKMALDLILIPKVKNLHQTGEVKTINMVLRKEFGYWKVDASSRQKILDTALNLHIW